MPPNPAQVRPENLSQVDDNPESAAVEPSAPEGSTEGPSPWGNSLPDDDIDQEACRISAEPVGPVCTMNSDCGICHDGSDCGRPANREEIEREGDACRIPDAAECEYAVVRCCAGRCLVTDS